MNWSPASLPRGGGVVRLDLSGAVAEVVLDQPARRNALSPGMMVDLGAAVDALSRWSGVAVLLRGEGGRAFCAGGDLVAVQSHLLGPGMGARMCDWMGSLLDRFASLPLVRVAAVEGYALGGGAELLTACDLVVADPQARIGFVHASLGVSPGWGGGRRLVARVGRRAALRALAGSERLGADAAMSLGLVDWVAEPGCAVEEARGWLSAVADHDPGAVRAAIAIANGVDASGESALFAGLWGAPAHLAALDRMGRRR